MPENIIIYTSYQQFHYTSPCMQACIHPPIYRDLLIDTMHKYASLLCFISEIDEVLQDLKADEDKPHPELFEDIQNFQSMINDRYSLC